MNIQQLTKAQRYAATGQYVRCLSGYIRDIAPNFAYFAENWRQEVRSKSSEPELRSLSAIHSRLPDNTAQLLLGFESFLSYAYLNGCLDDSSYGRWKQKAREVLIKVALAQSKYLCGNQPAHRFVSLVQAALIAGHAHIAHKDGRNPENAARWGWREIESGVHTLWQPQGERIGWVDGENLYLFSSVALSVVKRTRISDGIIISERMLHKHLHEQDLLESVDMTRQTLTVRRSFQGARYEVLHLHSETLVPTRD